MHMYLFVMDFKHLDYEDENVLINKMILFSLFEMYLHIYE